LYITIHKNVLKMCVIALVFGFILLCSLWSVPAV
jgi:hypothetical protein